MKSKSSKRAIALISLVVVILILVLLSGMVTYVSTDMIAYSKEIAFAKDITIVTDAADEYYAVNGSIPVLDGGMEFTASEYVEKVKSIRTTEVADNLNTAIIENGDEQAIFYEIDITKIGIEELKFGLKSDENDILLISNISKEVYYLKGYKVSNQIYFSSSQILEK